MKFNIKEKCRLGHHYIVDKSLEFGTCSRCGSIKKRKQIGWQIREENEAKIAELERDHREGNL